MLVNNITSFKALAIIIGLLFVSLPTSFAQNWFKRKKDASAKTSFQVKDKHVFVGDTVHLEWSVSLPKGKPKVMRENLLMDNIKYVTIHFVIDTWLYLDDENDALRGEKRDIDLNHKMPIISKDISRFGIGYSIDYESNVFYVTMRTGSLFN